MPHENQARVLALDPGVAIVELKPRGEEGSAKVKRIWEVALPRHQRGVEGKCRSPPSRIISTWISTNLRWFKVWRLRFSRITKLPPPSSRITTTITPKRIWRLVRDAWSNGIIRGFLGKKADPTAKWRATLRTQPQVEAVVEAISMPAGIASVTYKTTIMKWWKVVLCSVTPKIIPRRAPPTTLTSQMCNSLTEITIQV